MQLSHAWRQRLLRLLLPLLVATEFIDASTFVFSAEPIASGLALGVREFALVLAAGASGGMLMIGLQQWLTRHFGYRRYLMAALLLFQLGALGSGLAKGLSTLLLARWVQGFGAGALFTSSRILVMLLFARDARPQALRHYISLLFGLSALGPVLAAGLLQTWGWRAVFAAPLPLAALSLWGVWALLPHEVGRHGAPVRWATTPLLLFAAAVGLLQLSLSQARFPALQEPVLLALAIGGGLLLLCFGLHQGQREHSLLRWHELRQPVYLLGLLLYFLYYLIANASNYIFPVFAQRVLNLPLNTVGWLASFAAAASWLAALIYVRYSVRVVQKRGWMMAGAAWMALSAAWFAHLPSNAPWLVLLPALAAKGVFGALFVLPVASLTFRDLGDERFGPGYQSKNLLRHLAISLGMAVAAIGQGHLQTASTPALACAQLYHYLALASLALLGLVLAQQRFR